MPTTRVHIFCENQPTTPTALLRIQLIIPPVIPCNASAALIPNRPNRDDKVLSLFLTHSFKLASSLGGGLPPPDATAPHRRKSSNEILQGVDLQILFLVE